MSSLSIYNMMTAVSIYIHALHYASSPSESSFASRLSKEPSNAPRQRLSSSSIVRMQNDTHALQKRCAALDMQLVATRASPATTLRKRMMRLEVRPPNRESCS